MEKMQQNPNVGMKLLMDAYQERLYWHIRRLVVSHDDAQDLLQAVRFLWDYLNGDHYWKCKYPEHNLVRAQNQWHLFLKAKEHEEEMKEVINNL